MQSAITSFADGKATCIKKLFRRECIVSINIKAGPEKIWPLLTDVKKYASWNSTIQEIKGDIAPKGRVKLRVKDDPNRLFSLMVTDFVQQKSMAWESGMTPFFKSLRTFTLTLQPGGSTDFEMTEVMSGVMLLFIGGMLPDFRPSFEQIASDLKRAAEGA